MRFRPPDYAGCLLALILFVAVYLYFQAALWFRPVPRGPSMLLAPRSAR